MSNDILQSNLINYIAMLSKPYYLSMLDSKCESEDECDFSIPISLVSEVNMADKFIENLKHLIRNSIEYKQWVKWFKGRYTPIVCSVTDNTKTIEVHHHPLTLEDYVHMALAFIYKNKLTYTTFLVADIVMRWHFQQKVGACYMCKTYHDRFHDEKDVIIPEHCIHWDYENFMDDFIIKQCIDDYILGKIVMYMPQLVKDNPTIFKGINPSKAFDYNFRAPI